MEPIYRQSFQLSDLHVDCTGRLRPSAILYFAQEVAGQHCKELSLDWETLASKGLFWAVLRHRVQITRLPRSGETVRIETWPMPTARTYYPRSTVAYDAEGNELFRSIGMWVLMDASSRAMILPGKSGVTVDGMLTGTELAAPGSLAARQLEKINQRRVCYTDLDRNGHMNNTKYLEWISDLLPSAFHKEHTLTEFTVCYHAEAREGHQMHMSWQLDENGQLQVESWREAPEEGGFHRIFAARLQYGQEIL